MRGGDVKKPDGVNLIFFGVTVSDGGDVVVTLPDMV